MRREAIDPDYARIHRGSDGVLMTFEYEDGPRTLRAISAREGFELARARWGDSWLGEPCISSPWFIWCDVTGLTEARRGGAMTAEWLKQRRKKP